MFLATVRKKFIKELTIVGVVLTAFVVAVYHCFIPERYFIWFPLIPIFFYLVGLFYIGLFSFYYRLGTDKLVTCYLLCKVLKFMASAIVMFMYACFIGHEIVAFMITFIFFFFAFLIFETRFFLKFETRLKNRKNNQ